MNGATRTGYEGPEEKE